MIAFIRVQITKGEITKQESLLSLIEPIFRHRLSTSEAQSVQKSIRRMPNALVYACIPMPASEAFFLWISPHEFLILLETFHQGNLLDSSEGIVKELGRRLKQADMSCKFEIQLRHMSDNKIYIIGKPISVSQHLWGELKENIISVVIAIFLAAVAKAWLGSYYEEALATILGLFLFTIWRLFIVLFDIRDKTINWSIYE